MMLRKSSSSKSGGRGSRKHPSGKRSAAAPPAANGKGNAKEVSTSTVMSPMSLPTTRARAAADVVAMSPNTRARAATLERAISALGNRTSSAGGSAKKSSQDTGRQKQSPSYDRKQTATGDRKRPATSSDRKQNNANDDDPKHPDRDDRKRPATGVRKQPPTDDRMQPFSSSDRTQTAVLDTRTQPPHWKKSSPATTPSRDRNSPATKKPIRTVLFDELDDHEDDNEQRSIAHGNQVTKAGHSFVFDTVIREVVFTKTKFANLDVDLKFSNVPNSICRTMATRLKIADNDVEDWWESKRKHVHEQLKKHRNNTIKGIKKLFQGKMVWMTEFVGAAQIIAD